MPFSMPSYSRRSGHPGVRDDTNAQVSPVPPSPPATQLCDARTARRIRRVLPLLCGLGSVSTYAFALSDGFRRAQALAVCKPQEEYLPGRRGEEHDRRRAGHVYHLMNGGDVQCHPRTQSSAGPRYRVGCRWSP
ncbi:hypothetical protein CC85DRAFT_184743 [Cutaneotrichosporon oleaginosum]|uniref:Uncharacterized protein n=1 Tax=Cutaneotrichosporon oleaginosum TaxID=879819 RepID=A0A0J0XEY5_9TREE|nr:uncharacterized protein CC85DRAFT_184743 [Cutaneotrichosporon oleaginosum]KLT39642.1 hypothetical protein CC85DRAFT_184743 [Cutaneotrichosporon oleaginosum]TXT05660.1 hypothetical protein COLE_06980 [Cutaneotrichosporon oleaginosum]